MAYPNPYPFKFRNIRIRIRIRRKFTILYPNPYPTDNYQFRIYPNPIRYLKVTEYPNTIRYPRVIESKNIRVHFHPLHRDCGDGFSPNSSFALLLVALLLVALWWSRGFRVL
ncbi:unnamed protein product [Cuscuta campestris]|uniref:Uncharacterized protein n=1 Tax=Cuscuta campestris TaxID=132261 RepID=A0A484NIQ7_9ASTE|nr:unnamed protein product [Cuscuta campestris]